MRMENGNGPSWRYWAKVGLLFAAYFATGKIGLSLDAVSGFATLVWPPTGIALAALLLGGRGLWPGVALGAFFVNLTAGASIPVAAGIATGNTLEAVVGATLLGRAGFQAPLERLRDVGALIGLAGLLSTAISATVGPLSLILGGTVPASDFGATARAWWVGDAMGDLVVASFLLAWSRWPRPRWAPPRIAEAGGVAALLALLGAVVFGMRLEAAFAYLTLPPLVWAALRFGPRGATAATLGLSLLAVAGTARGLGPFTGPRLSDSLTQLEIFVGTVAASAMILAAVSAQRTKVEERVLRAVEAAPAAMLMVDARGQIRMANAQAEKVFGYSREELMGRSIETLVPERFRGKHPGDRAGFFADPQARPMGRGRDLFGLRKDGTEVPVEIGLSHVEMTEGTFVLASVIDITERKRVERALRESEERYRLVTETATDAILLIDAESRIRFANAAAEKLFGYTRPELLGQPLTMLMPEPLRGRHLDALRRYLATGERHIPWSGVELPALHKRGREIPVEISFGEYRADGERFFTGVVRDLTERKRAERAKAELREFLRE